MSHANYRQNALFHTHDRPMTPTSTKPSKSVHHAHAGTASHERRSSAEQEKIEALVRDIYERRIHFNRLVGFKVTSLEPQKVTMSFSMRDELVGNFVQGRLHGGVIGTALDSVGGLAVSVGLMEKFANESMEQIGMRFGRVGTIDLRVDYLRPGLGDHFVASAQVLRLGGRIASVQMQLADSQGELVATGSAAYIIT